MPVEHGSTGVKMWRGASFQELGRAAGSDPPAPTMPAEHGSTGVKMRHTLIHLRPGPSGVTGLMGSLLGLMRQKWVIVDLHTP